MKSFVLAATVVAGLLCTSGTADAQFRNRGNRNSYYSSGYYSPSYSYPAYSYGTPTYYGNGVVTSGYSPGYYNGGVVTSGYTPTDPATVVSDLAGSYLNQVLPGAYTPSYAYPSSYGAYPAYGGYSPMYSGGSSRGLFGRRR